MITAAQFSEEERGAIRAALEAQRREVATNLHAVVTRMRDHSTDAAPAKESDVSDATELDVAMAEILGATLRRIDDAMAALARGAYGLCARCNQRIAAIRLQAMPFAAQCRDCESARERANRERRQKANLHAPGFARIDAFNHL
jgi:DnaK suppressor protein